MLNVVRINNNTIVFKYNELNDEPNLVYFYGKNKALLVDSGINENIALEVKEYLKSNKLRLPDYLIITHYHWDHSFGIAYFDSISYGSSYTNERLKEFKDIDFTKDNYISDNLINEFSALHLALAYPNLNDIKIKLCDEVINEEITFDLGGVKAKAIPITSSHTPGSIVVACSDVIAIGDSDCGYIVGKEFFEDYPKLQLFLNEFKNIDGNIVINGHSNPIGKEEFISEIIEVLTENK